MRQYVVRRLLLFVPTLFGASLLVFVLMRLVPGDIAEILVYQTGSEASGIQKRQRGGWKAGSSRTRSWRGVKPGVTVYDNNTFMKAWIAQ